MRGLDTNVLVRYIADDDPIQSPCAAKLIEDCQVSGEPLFLAALVLCELVWVLTTAYRLRRPEIADTLERVLEKDLFRIEHEALVRRATEAYRTRKADFSDYVIGEISRSAGCRDTVTFDRVLSGEPGFTLISR